MKRTAMLLAVVLAVAAPSEATDSPEKSLLKCQLSASKEIAKFSRKSISCLSRCLNKAQADLESGEIRAGKTCLKELLAIHSNQAQLMASAIAFECVAGNSDSTHVRADVVGPSVGTPLVSEPLYSRGLENLCGGILDEEYDWILCLRDRIRCNVLSSIAVTYPRILDLLDLVETQILGLPFGDEDFEGRRYNVASTISELRAIIDGVPVDGVPDINCGP